MVDAGKLHEPGVGDVLREIPAVLDGNEPVLDRCITSVGELITGKTARTSVAYC